jgi:hypothetical protein
MDTKEMIEVMQAHIDGKEIQIVFRDDSVASPGWEKIPIPSWNWSKYVYRIAPEPKKEGRWERVEVILTGDSLYMFRCPHQANVLVGLPNAARYPGFGGIDYRSPFDEKVIVRSMVPVMFEPCGVPLTAGHDDGCRPGIPVAAWFWREEK